MKKNIALIMIITLFTKVLGFGREVALSYFYGAGTMSDVFLIAQTIPTTLFALIGTGLGTTFIPIYSKVQKEKGEKEALRFSSNVINSVLLVTFIIIGAVLIFTPQVLMLFASGFSGETMALAITYTRISVFGIAFSGMIYILNAYLQIRDSFVIPALISLPMNVVIILSFYFADRLNDIILAYGLVASVLVQLLFVLPAAFKNRFRYRPILNRKDIYLRELLILALPIILGTSVNQLNIIVDKNIATNVAVGGVSALNYASRLNVFIQGLFVTPVITVIYPRLSRLVLQKDESGLKKVMNDSLVYISLLVIPATVGAMVLASPIIELLFMRGKFNETAAVMTAQALFYYSIGMFAVALREIFSRIFYAYKDTKTPTINALIGLVLNIALNIILSRYMGIGGLALATSISATLTTLLLMKSLKKKLTHFGFQATSVKIIRITIASSVMGFAAYGAYFWLSGFFSGNLSLILSVAAGGLVYLAMIFFLRIEEVGMLMDIIRKKLSKGRESE